MIVLIVESLFRQSLKDIAVVTIKCIIYIYIMRWQRWFQIPAIRVTGPESYSYYRGICSDH